MNQNRKAQISIRVLRDGESPEIPGGQITPEMIERLPDNCFVIPMKILDPPEPIKRRD